MMLNRVGVRSNPCGTTCLFSLYRETVLLMNHWDRNNWILSNMLPPIPKFLILWSSLALPTLSIAAFKSTSTAIVLCFLLKPILISWARLATYSMVFQCAACLSEFIFHFSKKISSLEKMGLSKSFEYTLVSAIGRQFSRWSRSFPFFGMGTISGFRRSLGILLCPNLIREPENYFFRSQVTDKFGNIGP